MESFSQFRKTLDTRFGGKLSKGNHLEHTGKACAIECANAALGRPWGDTASDWPDFRLLHDALIEWLGARLATPLLVAMMEAYWDWGEWSIARRVAVAQKIALGTVQRVVSLLPGLPPNVAAQCREARSLSEALGAARAVARAAEAVWVPEAALVVARAVAWAEEAAAVRAEAAAASEAALGAARAAAAEVATAAGRLAQAAVRAEAAAWAEAQAAAAVRADAAAAAAAAQAVAAAEARSAALLCESVQVWIEAAGKPEA